MRFLYITPRSVRRSTGSCPASRHGSLAGVAMPAHRRRCRCASHRADCPSGHRTGTARSLHDDPAGSPVRYASRAPRDASSRLSHRLACIAATPSRVTLATPRPVRRSTGHARPRGTARWRAWRCLRIADAAAAHRTVPIAPADAAPARLARFTTTPPGRRFATPRARRAMPRYVCRTGSLASRPRLRVSRSLRLGRCASRQVMPGLTARLAGGRGDACASPTLPLRIAPCRSPQRTPHRHGSLASRRPRRVAGSLRLARAEGPSITMTSLRHRDGRSRSLGPTIPETRRRP